MPPWLARVPAATACSSACCSPSERLPFLFHFSGARDALSSSILLRPASLAAGPRPVLREPTQIGLPTREGMGIPRTPPESRLAWRMVVCWLTGEMGVAAWPSGIRESCGHASATFFFVSGSRRSPSRGTGQGTPHRRSRRACVLGWRSLVSIAGEFAQKSHVRSGLWALQRVQDWKRPMTKRKRGPCPCSAGGRSEKRAGSPLTFCLNRPAPGRLQRGN